MKKWHLSSFSLLLAVLFFSVLLSPNSVSADSLLEINNSGNLDIISSNSDTHFITVVNTNGGLSSFSNIQSVDTFSAEAVANLGLGYFRMDNNSNLSPGTYYIVSCPASVQTSCEGGFWQDQSGMNTAVASNGIVGQFTYNDTTGFEILAGGVGDPEPEPTISSNAFVASTTSLFLSSISDYGIGLMAVLGALLTLGIAYLVFRFGYKKLRGSVR
jgi:hypothetical protein